MGKLLRDETGIEIVEQLKGIRKALGDTVGETIYGFHINSKNSDPYGAVTYLRDAVGMNPVHMDFANDIFDFGTWADAFFLPRPCMVKFDGTVDYYLDANDYTKKADGTPSDVADANYQGNAMMEWGKNGRKIWLKVVPDANDNTSCEVFIADHKADDGYHAWSFINGAGEMVNHFYTPIYNGSSINGKLRSISGKTIARNLSATNEIAQARANYDSSIPMWNIDMYSDVILINFLLILLGKSLNTQAVFGLGNQSGYGADATDYGLLQSGTMNSKGMFWGKNVSSVADNSGVKVFGMENWWSNQWRRTAGLCLQNGQYKVKLCYGTDDGSMVDDYNLTGDGYLDMGASPTSDGYVAKMAFSEDAIMLPNVVNASSTTFYSDYFYQNQDGNRFALRGGSSRSGAACGAFYWSLDSAAGTALWHIGASPSLKPLS